MSHEKVREELVKVAIQVLVFGIVGGGVKLLLERRAAHRRFQADMLDRLGRAHKEVYRIRRLLPNSDAATARVLLGQLMDARQDLGAAYHAARIWGLGPQILEVQNHTEAMRAYLEAIVSSALAAADSPERGRYVEFVDWPTVGSYERDFKARYLLAKKLVDPAFRPTARLMKGTSSRLRLDRAVKTARR